MSASLGPARAKLTMARWFVAHEDAGPAGVWPRAAAVLGRQAIEAGLDVLWSTHAPGVEATTARCQLSCLPTVLRDDAVAGDAAYAWSRLSRACHHCSYELAPTAVELQGLLDVVARVLDVVGRRCGGDVGDGLVAVADTHGRATPPSEVAEG